ncbi:MAG: VOC family protein [Gemmatimonadetes bacterium]|nr:VOC family protein [Gemmatimonadota bacterium]
MDSKITKLLNDLGDEQLSRRQLLKGFALAAVAAPAAAVARPAAGALSNGSAPWRTVYLDHISYAVADHKRSADFYASLMGWQRRGGNTNPQATQTSLSIGDVGGIIIRNNRQAGPAAPAREGRPPLTGVINHISWGVEPWDTEAARAELTRRGLNPREDFQGDSFRSFHVLDPDGWDLQISNVTRARAAQGNGASAPMSTPAAPWKTVWLDHISYAVADYKRSVDFYADLMGWEVENDNGNTQATLKIGNIGGIIIRNNRQGTTPQMREGRPPLTGVINHISWGIQPWDTERVKAELTRRTLNPRDDMVGDDFKSYHVLDPDGWDLQISNQTS